MNGERQRDDSDVHDHEWQRRQNVTSRGYRMTPYEVCVVDGCDAARQVSEKERGMSDIREALVALMQGEVSVYRKEAERFADAILAEFDVTEREEGRWEYGVRWGDDGTVTNCGSRERAESRAAESHGDKIVRRTPARTIPAGEWEEVPRG